MKRFGMLRMIFSENIITIFCSEPDVLEEMRSMIAENAHSIEVNRTSRYHYVLHTDKVNSHEAYAWIIQYFCREGWEPYGIGETNELNAFRKEF